MSIRAKSSGIKINKGDDLGEFIQNEFNDISPSTGAQPMRAIRKKRKLPKTNYKPSFAGKKINKKEPAPDEQLSLNNSGLKQEKTASRRTTPFENMRARNRPTAKSSNVPIQKADERQKIPQGPPKLLAFQEKVKNNNYEGYKTPVKVSENESSTDGYTDDDFEADAGNDNGKKRLFHALEKENRKALKFSEKKIPQMNTSNTSFFMANPDVHSRETYSSGGSRPRFKTPKTGLTGGTKLVVNIQKVTISVICKQDERIENLRPIVQIEIEEYDNQLNIKPQTAQDLYFNKLQTFKIQNEMIQTNDDNISRDIQTDPIEEKDFEVQAPEDLFNKKDPSESQQGARDLDGFIQRVTPVMEMICEENVQLADFLNPSAKDKNPVEEKAKISFPFDLCKVLQSKLQRVCCVHSFETVPHRKCAVSYVLESQEGEESYITVVYHLSSSNSIKYLKTPNEVTCICTPFESVVICGTKLGSICVFDLDENFRKEEVNLGDQIGIDFEMEALRHHYKILEPTFSTDGLPDIVHFFEITKLVCLVRKGAYRVVAIDNAGKLSSWILIEFSEGDCAGSLADLTLKVGGKIKLAFHSEIDLSEKLKIIYDPDTFEITFDPNDHNSFIFSTSDGLYYSKLYNKADDNLSKKGGPIIRTLDTSSVGELIRVTSISYSDKGFILTGFEDGSIGLYHIDFSAPLSIWYHSCKASVKEIKWCTIYFSETRNQSLDPQFHNTGTSDSRFASRLCEFFVIDARDNFYIWNLSKSIHKPIHMINFGEKHGLATAHNPSTISNTCLDQSFFTGFCAPENQVVFYFMNFKKGTRISKEKIDSENEKSLRLLKLQPNFF